MLFLCPYVILESFCSFEVTVVDLLPIYPIIDPPSHPFILNYVNKILVSPDCIYRRDEKYHIMHVTRDALYSSLPITFVRLGSVTPI